ncbi:MAG TPA: branched-chain amino acid ABC transporter permease [Yaniella sp.]
MGEILQVIINALSLGSLHALLALGLVMVFGILKLVNFAYGELIMVAGYTWYALQPSWVPLILIMVVAIAAVVFTSVATERIAFRPLRSGTMNAMLITSFAVSTVLQSSALIFISPRPSVINVPSWLTTYVSIGPAQISVLNLVIFGVSMLTLLGLMLIMQKTRLGITLRAAADDFRMLQLLGIRADQVIAMAFVISGLLAGIAGVLWVSRIGMVWPTIGMTPLLIAIIAIVVGGMNSLKGAIVGGFFMGGLHIIMQTFLPQNLLAFMDAFIFGVVILVLVFRPEGIVKARLQTERIG